MSSAAKSCINCRYQQCLKIGMVPELLQGKRRRMTLTGDDGANEEEEEEGGGSENEDRKNESENSGDEPNHEVPDVKIEMDVEQQISPDPEATGYMGDRSLGAIPKDAALRPSVIKFQRGSHHPASHVQRQRESREEEGELTPIVPGYGGMTVSGEIFCQYFFINIQNQFIHFIYSFLQPTYIYKYSNCQAHVKVHPGHTSGPIKFITFSPIQIRA